jgi:hypothetical protein
MSLKSLKLVIYYIRPEDLADMALRPSATRNMRLNEGAIMCRSLFLTPRRDNYLSLIVSDMKMIEELESPGESYL